MGMVSNAEPTLALLISKVLTHPCCHLMTVLWVRCGREHYSHQILELREMKWLAQGHREVSWICKARSLKVWALDLGTSVFKAQLWWLLAMWQTLVAPVSTHPYPLALITAGNAAQLLTASPCIYVASRDCLAPSPSSLEVTGNSGSLGAASTRTDWSWWKIPSSLIPGVG